MGSWIGARDNTNGNGVEILVDGVPLPYGNYAEVGPSTVIEIRGLLV